MKAHPLDRPVWSALTTQQTHLSLGGALARRFQPEINVFAAVADESEAALRALAALVAPGEHVYTLQATEMTQGGGLVCTHADAGVQMWLRAPIAPADAEGVEDLSLADSAEMCALTALTNPGPFLPGTPRMGRFIGVRRAGKLIAMAGERMAMDDFVEVSGVCVDPASRGLGLAGRLSALVAARIQARGQTPFLHAWKSNAPAITLYRKLGFALRREMCVAVWEKG